ncbi:MAG: four helix bundle protein [Acidobacteria bacterium]|nr:four helix bundle protein [Acidobacteriota bacterium]
MQSQHEILCDRTRRFALRIVQLFRSLPRSPEAQVMGRQLLRCGTAVAANYRATGRARSKAEFVAKIGVVVEEADETVFWIEMLADSGTVRRARLEDLLKEARELLAIFAASQRTTRRSADRSDRAENRSVDDPMSR